MLKLTDRDIYSLSQMNSNELFARPPDLRTPKVSGH